MYNYLSNILIYLFNNGYIPLYFLLLLLYDLGSIYIVSGSNYDLTCPIHVQLHLLILLRVDTAFHSRIRREQVLPSNFQ